MPDFRAIVGGFRSNSQPTHCPKRKRNDKKPSKFQFHFPGLLVPFSMLKKWKKKSANLDFGDNPIYPLSDPDGQDREVCFLGGKRLTFYSYPTLLYCVMANFPLERPKN